MDINKHNIVVDNELNIKLINFSSTINFESHQPNDLPYINKLIFLKI